MLKFLNKLIRSTIFLGVMLTCQANVFGSSLTPISLKCENAASPMFIDELQPRLSWNFAGDGRNQFQSAFEILISDNPAQLNSGIGNVWTTGKVISPENINVVYQGEALRSFTRYYWKVRIYDDHNMPSSWSEPAFFETAMLNSSDWKAKWIDDGSRNPENDADAFKPDRMPLFRKGFSTVKQISVARLYISGLGYYEAYLNGKKIGDQVLDPGWTTYREEVLYSVHDVTSLISKGENVTSIMLGNGWWNPVPIKLFGRWDLRNYQQTGRPCVIAQLHINYTDGTSEVIFTDNSWLTSPGPVVKNSVYLGEHYDAQLEQQNWNKNGVLSKDWRNARIADGPSGKLVAQRLPPIRVTKILKPVRILTPAPDTFVVDMGQNFAGVARLKVKGVKGQKITLRYGENIFKDGRLNFSTSVMTQIRKGGIPAGPGAPETAWQEDSYTLNGNGVEVWSPRFTFHGFRYVEVTGWRGKLSVNDIEGLRMNSDLKEASQFSSSNEMFNKLNEVIRWTFLSNVFSVQSDCPAREKMGYGADMVVSANAFIYNYDMPNFYRKAVRDFANEQQADGAITEIAPFTGIADRGYGGNSGPLGWQLGFAFLQKQLYDFYGDKRIVEENYDRVKKQVEFLESKSYEGLFHWDIGDHEALDPRAEAFSASAFYYHHVILAKEFAGIVGNKEDSLKYEKLAQKIKQLIVRKYLVPGTGRFDNGTQSPQIMALWYDLTPEVENTFKTLMQEFERHQWHVSSGIFGTKMMFDVLREHDKNEMAYRIANQKDFPGWGHMLEGGATTLWETWEFPELYASQNHPMFGSISEWFFRSLGGINPDGPGFSKIIVKPQPVADLSWVKTSYQSVRGLIVSEWRQENGKLTFKVAIPANTKAEVWIPASSDAVVTESDRTLETQKITVLKNEQKYKVVQVGSGTYTFTSTKIN
jgi:alpha-L-rhamnosidase